MTVFPPQAATIFTGTVLAVRLIEADDIAGGNMYLMMFLWTTVILIATIAFLLACGDTWR